MLRGSGGESESIFGTTAPKLPNDEIDSVDDSLQLHFPSWLARIWLGCNTTCVSESSAVTGHLHAALAQISTGLRPFHGPSDQGLLAPLPDDKL